MIRHTSSGKHFLRTEEFTVKGSQLGAMVDEIMHQGNVRRIILRNAVGRDIIEIPLMDGLDESLTRPILAAAGAVGTAAGEEVILMEKEFEVEEDGL